MVLVDAGGPSFALAARQTIVVSAARLVFWHTGASAQDVPGGTDPEGMRGHSAGAHGTAKTKRSSGSSSQRNSPPSEGSGS